MRFREFAVITEAVQKIAIVGDSIAVGIVNASKNAVSNAKVGANSSTILANVTNDESVQGADVAVISAGSNDIVKGKGDPNKLVSNLQSIKSALKAKSYVWILPYNEVARKAVSSVAAGDKTIDLTEFPSADGIHPSNYSSIAKSVTGGAGNTVNDAKQLTNSATNAATEKKPSAAGYYTVGDSVAANLAAAGKPWISKATPGASVSDPSITQALDSIPKGSVVAISVGADDKSVDSPEQLSFKIKGIISHAKSNGLYPIFVLFPANVNNRTERNTQIREVLKKEIITAMIDIDSGNGLASMSTISNQIVSLLKPGKGYVPVSKGQGPKRKFNSQMVSDISQYLATKMDDNHRLGILANIKAESNFNPGAYNPNDVNGPSGGLFQHHDNLKTKTDRRFSKMVAASGGKDAWQTNWKAQIDFALSEPMGAKYLATNFASPEEASKWWTINFEVPKDRFNVAQSRTAFLQNFA